MVGYYETYNLHGVEKLTNEIAKVFMKKGSVYRIKK